MQRVLHHRKRLLPTAVLVSSAIVGLLIMHGLEAATLSLTTDASLSHHDDGSATDVHGALGICVFVVSVVGLGVAALKAGRQRQRFIPAWPATATSVQGSGWSRPAGRPLLLDLSVLRL